MRQVTRIIAWVSQGVNVTLLWVLGTQYASPDLTISARCYIQGEVDGHRGWRRAQRVIDGVFFWQKAHCRGSYLRDVEFAELITEVEARRRAL